MNVDANSSSLFGAFELDLAIHESKESEVGTEAYAVAGPELVALLANDDRACANDFASVLLDASSLTV